MQNYTVIAVSHRRQIHYDFIYVHWDNRSKDVFCYGLGRGSGCYFICVQNYCLGWWEKFRSWMRGDGCSTLWLFLILSLRGSPNHLRAFLLFVVIFMSMFRTFGIMFPIDISTTICLVSPFSILLHAHLLSFTLSSRKRDWWYIWLGHLGFSPYLLVSNRILFSGYELNIRLRYNSTSNTQNPEGLYLLDSFVGPGGMLLPHSLLFSSAECICRVYVTDWAHRILNEDMHHCISYPG